MSILRGKKYIVETVEQFIERVGVDDTEIFDVLSDDHGEWLVGKVNDIRRHNGEEQFDSADELIERVDDIHIDLRDELLREIVERHGLDQTIIDVLKARDDEYVHLYDGTVHTIVHVDIRNRPH